VSARQSWWRRGLRVVMLKVFWRSSANQGEETHRFEREKNQIPESVFTVITEEQPGSQASRRFLWLM